MIAQQLNLRIFSFLNIQKAETRKLVYFAILQFMISAIIGLLTGTVDSLFITHTLLPLEATFFKTLLLTTSEVQSGAVSTILQAFGGALLMIAGLLYAGVTDRNNKTRMFPFFLKIASSVFLGAFILSYINDNFFAIPFLYPFFYSTRFLAGVFLTVLFWDITGMYIDHRQGKRIYGYVMMSGAAGYSLGSILIGVVNLFIPIYFAFLGAVALSAVCLLHFTSIQKSFVLVQAPSYKSFSKNEALEALKDFFRQPVMFYILLSTLAFGLISGIMMTSYNNLITARYSADATGVMSILRSVATMLEAVIMTQLLSQVSLGRDMKSGIILQWVFLVLGILGFLVSMVGVADFTRQIVTSLLSPAMVSLFASISGKNKGRAITVNSMIIAPAGMLLSPAVYLLLSVSGYAYAALAVVIGLVLLRFFLNSKTSKHYRNLMAMKITNDALNLSAGLENSIDAALSSESCLSKLMEKSTFVNQKIRTALWQQLAKKVVNPDAFRILCNFTPQNKAPELEYFYMLACRFDFEEYRTSIEDYLKTIDPFTGSILYLSYLNLLKDHDENTYIQHKNELLARINAEKDAKALQDLFDIWFQLYDSTDFAQFRDWWNHCSNRESLIYAMEKRPHPDFKEFLYEEIGGTKDPLRLAGLIAALPPIDRDNLHAVYHHTTRMDVKFAILKIWGSDDHEKTLQLLCGLFLELSARYTLNDDFSSSALLSCYYRKGKDDMKEFISVMKVISSYAVPLPEQITKAATLLADQTEAYIATLFWCWHQKRPGQLEFFPLIKKIIDEDISNAVRLYFALCCIEAYRTVDSVIISNTIGLIENNSMDVTLKLTDASSLLMQTKRKNFLLNILEPISVAEKLIRLHPSVPDSTFSFQEICAYWKTLPPQWLEKTRMKLIQAI